MASYSESYVSLPSYLEKWPDLHTDADIDLFCKMSQRTDAEIERRTRALLSEDNRMNVRKGEALDFHKALRSELKQQRW